MCTRLLLLIWQTTSLRDSKGLFCLFGLNLVYANCAVTVVVLMLRLSGLLVYES